MSPFPRTDLSHSPCGGQGPAPCAAGPTASHRASSSRRGFGGDIVRGRPRPVAGWPSPSSPSRPVKVFRCAQGFVPGHAPGGDGLLMRTSCHAGCTRSILHGICATCITAPCTRGNFGADFGAAPGADMYPASVAALVMPRARMMFEGRVQIKAACSTALCCTLVLPIPSHDYCAKLLLALLCSDVLATAGRLMPPRPETCGRRSGPSVPSCSPAQPEPASRACATADHPAMCRVALTDGRPV